MNKNLLPNRAEFIFIISKKGDVIILKNPFGIIDIRRLQGNMMKSAVSALFEKFFQETS
jgi:hypothetical protein